MLLIYVCTEAEDFVAYNNDLKEPTLVLKRLLHKWNNAWWNFYGIFEEILLKC